MRRRLPRQEAHEPSLVPLADMLTNTVGITLFILIFTVLTAGGVLLAKHLPMEHGTDKKPFMVVCAGGRVYLCSDDIVHRFLDPLGKIPNSRSEVDHWLNTFESHKLEDPDFVVTGSVRRGRSVALVLTPRATGGFATAEIGSANSAYRGALKDHPGDKWFIFYLVQPDSIDAFLAAREIAMQQNFDVGWDPLGPNDPLRLGIGGGGGRTPDPQ